MALYGLIGYPLGHSFSVSYFSKLFEDQGIVAEYRNFPLESISGFRDLIVREADLKGLNVTVPYKEKVIPHLDTLDKTSRTIQAVNTIAFCRRNGRLTLLGYNTDVIGFKRSLKEHLTPHHKNALVLGTGGSSKAVVFVLESLGIGYTMVSRSRREGVINYEELNRSVMAEHSLIINTTPLGMYPDTDACPQILYDELTAEHLLFDLVYNPEKTQFLSRGEAQGATIVNGYRMLVYQAEASWEIWNKER